MQLNWNVLRSAVLVAMVTVFVFTVPVQVSAQQAKTQTLTGVMSDTTCGATRTMKNMTPAEYTRACAKRSGYALVVGTNVYTLQGHEAELEKLAAETVTVKGAVSGKTVNVESVAAAKKS